MSMSQGILAVNNQNISNFASNLDYFGGKFKATLFVLSSVLYENTAKTPLC